MIAIIRAFARSWAGKAIFVLLILVMGLFGAQSFVASGQLSNAVIKAGSREVSPTDFKRAWDERRKEVEQQIGRPPTTEEMGEAGVHRQLAERLSAQESLLEVLHRMRLTPGDKLLAAQLRQMPAFFNPITGAFDEATFEQMIGREGYTKPQFDRVLRDELSIMHFADAIRVGLRAPRILGAMEAGYSMETRDLSLFVIGQGAVQMPGDPTDAQLNQFIRENEERLRQPERRRVTLALFTAKALASQVSVPEAEVLRRFESNKARLSQGERRTFVQITLSDPRMAQRVVAALRAGQDPQAVAAAVRGQAVTYTEKSRSAVPDAAVAQQAFTLQPGQVSGLVQGPLGASVVKVIAIAPAREATLAEYRDEIVAAVRQEQEAEAIYDAVEKFNTARANGVSLTDAARQVGAQVYSVPVPMTAEGLAPNGRPLGWPEAILRTAFELPAGGESDEAEEVGDRRGEYFAVKVDQVFPSGLPTVAKDKEELTRAWKVFELRRRAEAKAQELAARVQRGESLQAVAASVGAQVQTQRDLPRRANPQLGADLVGRLFTGKKGDVFPAQVGPLTFVVARIDELHTPPPGPAGRVVEEQRPAVSGQLFGEMMSLAQAAARERVKPKVFEDRVARAAGFNPEDVAPAGKDGKKKK